MKKLSLRTQPPTGSLLLSALIFTSIFLILGSGLLSLTLEQYKLSLRRTQKISAIEIAEAGVNYYKWHLDNFPTDYADGTGQVNCNPCGPYVHAYDDPQGTTIGQFELYITPPSTTNTIVKIKSTGNLTISPTIKRISAVYYGQPSWAKYAILSNSNLRIGSGTTVRGPLHSNGGIRFDGIAYNEVTSATNTYNDSDSDACTVSSWGVHTCVAPADPSPPTIPPAQASIFTAGRNYPISNIDFNSVTTDLSALKTQAQNGGLYLNKSNKQGYHIQFISPTQLQYRTVKTTNTCSWSGGNSAPVGDIAQYQGNWTTVNIPNNGIIFVEDNLWVEGTITGKRITLVAAQEPLASGSADIWINNDIKYTAKDGSTALGIIAQHDINVGLYSEDDLEINGALLAQKGRVGRYYYPSSCSSTYYKRSSIVTYGSLESNQRYGFSWSCSGTYCSGYNTRDIQFDSDLVYSPPPSFPVSGEYTFISWEELLPGEAY